MKNRKQLQDICPATVPVDAEITRPSRPAIYPAVVYEMDSPENADRRLGGELDGFVYQRDGHPNAVMLAEKCRQLHQTECAAVTSSGMSALSLLVLARLKPGDEVLLSSRLYGKTVALLRDLAKWGITFRSIDMTRLAEVEEACSPHTRLLIVETISNPQLRVADLSGLAEIAHRHQAELLVDNTFASPVVCRPAQWGADWVWESMTKIMNGHGDLVMGLIAGGRANWAAIPAALSTWGMTASPFDCWLCERGLGTLYPRVVQASQSAQRVAEFLAKHNRVAEIAYPGLPKHPDHDLACRLFAGPAGPLFGHMIMFRIDGGTPAATRLIAGLPDIPFCPSLGELTTTLSHPASTSHRNQSPEAWRAVGIDGGTIRLSIGLENPDFVIDSLQRGLGSLDF